MSRKNSHRAEINLHGLNVAEAKLRLERLLVNLPPNVTELIVIHGYHGGNALQNMVRTQLKSNRIRQRMVSLNPGETILILKERK